ncbi:hypothetical protein [Stappia sp.]|uniref:hypothetical protein n=1 Tax=Stappia sp. TaxID=1870903 RepID=UPI003D0A3289
MMKTARHEPDGEPDPVKTAIWETEGTGTGHNTRMDQHFGRRIEPDRTWTIYHVYSGMPAVAGGQGMTGLSRSDATDGMLFLNDRNARRRALRNGGENKPERGLSGFLRAAWRRTGHLSWH